VSSYLIDDLPNMHAPFAAHFSGTPVGESLPAPGVDTTRALYRGTDYVAGTLAQLGAAKPYTAIVLRDAKSLRPLDGDITDAAGAFQFDGLAQDAEYLVLALHPARQYNAVVAHVLEAE
jgi:hypothetical protein